MKFRRYKLNDLSIDGGSYGIGASAVEYDKKLYTYLRITDINEDGTLNYKDMMSVNDPKANQYILKKNDICFVRTGNSTGKTYFYDESIKNLVYAGFLIKFSIDEEKVNPKYMKYYTMTNKYKNWVKEIQTGSTRGNINAKMYGNMDILIPERVYQDKLVVVLDKITAKIKYNTQTNDNLYEITNKLYEQLFFIERKDDWKEYNLQELMDISNGYSYTGKELVDTSVVGMATIKNFERTGGFKEEGFKDIEPIKAKDVHYADKFDILVACTDLTQNADIIGNAIMLLNSSRYEKVVISMDLVKILPKKNKYLVFSILNSKEFKNFALGYKTGTTVLHLNKNCFKDFNIRLPDLDKVENFEKMVETNYKKISYNLEENDMLIQLRDTLLPKLMNGEIDLDKIEI